MGPRPVVVLDTNVIVSALGWTGPERRVYELARSGRLWLATSRALLAELGRVLRYPRFDLPPDLIAAHEAELEAMARLVEPTRSLEVIRDDPDDNRVLECAVAARAHRIVSGDRHLLRLGSFGGIAILTAVQLLRELNQSTI